MQRESRERGWGEVKGVVIVSCVIVGSSGGGGDVESMGVRRKGVGQTEGFKFGTMMEEVGGGEMMFVWRRGENALVH